MNCNDNIRSMIQKKDSLLCVGLDVDPGKIPVHLKGKDRIFRFIREIIDATKDYAVAYKSNLAFFEAMGIEGWRILKKVLEYIPEDILKIGDGKRGDIGSTAERYAIALYDLGFDAVTVNPYLGFDSVRPFLQDETRGAFILCLTSNPGSKDFQYLNVDTKPLYQIVAEKAASWNQNGNIGLVVGATHPSELSIVRGIVPDLPFLIPGVGAQGGDLEASVMSGTDKNGEMAIINSSRGILYASGGPDFAEASRLEAERLYHEIRSIRMKKRSVRKMSTGGARPGE